MAKKAKNKKEELKQKLYKLIDSIEDEHVLNVLNEDVVPYVIENRTKEKVDDDLTEEQSKEKLAIAIDKVTRNPSMGKMSRKYKDIRSVLVTKHNRLYYQISDTTITFLELIEMKQSPHRNRYE
jgi:hypothetical protein